ncbi:H-NS family nucleoid-associated regulatory protein [Bradyrhizobium cosmicum]|uniref:H-NS histone family protein n=1 Tax=Bradyrhizobium cosmicum TaxID=1404864 RepID=UPI000A06F387|nr:H-NS histone family protein [Bradyrhizobium cosmicum]
MTTAWRKSVLLTPIKEPIGKFVAGARVKQIEFDGLPTNSLWTMYHEIEEALRERMTREKSLLDERIRVLNALKAGSRPYPAVPVKYRNPDRPNETWTGRGKRPRWMCAKLNAGHHLSDFKI